MKQEHGLHSPAPKPAPEMMLSEEQQKAMLAVHNEAFNRHIESLAADFARAVRHSRPAASGAPGNVPGSPLGRKPQVMQKSNWGERGGLGDSTIPVSDDQMAFLLLDSPCQRLGIAPPFVKGSPPEHWAVENPGPAVGGADLESSRTQTDISSGKIYVGTGLGHFDFSSYSHDYPSSPWVKLPDADTSLISGTLWASGHVPRPSPFDGNRKITITVKVSMGGTQENLPAEPGHNLPYILIPAGPGSGGVGALGSVFTTVIVHSDTRRSGERHTDTTFLYRHAGSRTMPDGGYFRPHVRTESVLEAAPPARIDVMVSVHIQLFRFGILGAATEDAKPSGFVFFDCASSPDREHGLGLLNLSYPAERFIPLVPGVFPSKMIVSVNGMDCPSSLRPQ